MGRWTSFDYRDIAIQVERYLGLLNQRPLDTLSYVQLLIFTRTRKNRKQDKRQTKSKERRFHRSYFIINDRRGSSRYPVHAISHFEIVHLVVSMLLLLFSFFFFFCIHMARVCFVSAPDIRVVDEASHELRDRYYKTGSGIELACIVKPARPDSQVPHPTWKKAGDPLPEHVKVYHINGWA